MKNLPSILLAFFLLTAPISLISQTYNGIWKSEGYGHIIHIFGNNADLYQVTQISNIFDDSYSVNGNELGTGEDLMGYMEIAGDQLILTLTGGTIVVFNALDNLPPISPDSDDPLTNFNIFWQTYEDWCALFPILNIDWQAEHDFYAAQINSSTTDAQLFNYMAEMLDKLNDGHSYLESDDGMYFEGGPEAGDLWDEYGYEMMDLIEGQYIDGGNFISSNSELIYYGTINDSIGYLYVYEMEGYAPNGNELDDNAAFSAEIDAALTYLQNTKALLVDMRFNTGGYDSNSRILANRLTKTQMPVYSKQVRTGGYSEFADSLVFYIQPDGVQYIDRPVIVLTSDLTLSAADVFAMTAKQIDCVTLMGETTYGILSDNYTKYLPNGWEFGISPERYKDNNNIDYEQLGIPPDIEISGSMEAFDNGHDNILEAAIDEIFGLCYFSSVNGFAMNNNLRIYPNPATDIISVEINLPNINKVSWSISDIYGRNLKENISKGDYFQTNIDSFPNGIYFLEIKADYKKTVTRFSVMK